MNRIYCVFINGCRSKRDVCWMWWKSISRQNTDLQNSYSMLSLWYSYISNLNCNWKLNVKCTLLQLQISIHVYVKPYINLKLRNNKVTTRRGQRSGTISLVSCKRHLSSNSKMSLRWGFRNLIFLDPFFSDARMILVLFFHLIWIVEFKRPNSRHT